MEKIGKGAFTTAYLNEKNNKVYLKSSDPMKECMAMHFFPSSRLFPSVRISDNPDYDYVMKYYPRVTSLKQNLKPEHWEAYKELRNLRINYRDVRSKYDYAYAFRNAFKTIKNRRFRIALIEAIEAHMNCGTDICFEISPRNVAVENGNLILLDCFFQLSKLK